MESTSRQYHPSTSGDITFNYGTGSNGFIDVSAIDTVSAFTLTGASLTTGDIVLASLSATQGININLGGMSGTISAAAVDTDGSFVLNTGSASNLQMILRLYRQSATVTLGAVSDSTQANGISSIQVDTFTLLDKLPSNIYSPRYICKRCQYYLR